MRLRAVLTDLDGTLLEPDGSVLPEALAALRRLATAGVPVCPVTSKTAAEVEYLARTLGISSPAGVENGAAIRRPDGGVQLSAAAVPVERLAAVLDHLRAATGAPARGLSELTDEEVRGLTGLPPAEVPLARRRLASVPLVVDREWDARLRAALPLEPPLLLLRGNRFLHLQGRHEKSSVVPELLDAVGRGTGVTVGCGDAPNDEALLGTVDIAVIVPGAGGPNDELRRAHPDAIVAPAPHGRGWAASLLALLDARCQA